MDLQIYAKCIKLKDNESIRSQLVFILWKIHILFAMIEVIGENVILVALMKYYLKPIFTGYLFTANYWRKLL